VFVPKYRRKAMFLEIRKFLGPVFHELACIIHEVHQESLVLPNLGK
jgi:REP element-mobilizing transposase RayT